MPLLETAETFLHYELHGHGEPVTAFAHGVASSIDDIRFLSSGVTGTRAFFHFRGHGRSGTPEGPDGWGYRSSARDLRAVADHVGATRCVGVSMGAGAILSVLAADLRRFDRIVLVLPAGLDQERPADLQSDLAEMVRRIEGGDQEALTATLISQLPPDVAAMRGVDQLMRRRAELMCRPGVARAIRALPDHPPVTDRAVLGSYAGRALVIAHEDDDTHPASIARDIAAALPDVQLHVFDRPWSMLRERAALRGLIAGFLGE